MYNFHSLEVVGRDSDPQLQVSGNWMLCFNLAVNPTGNQYITAISNSFPSKHEALIQWGPAINRHWVNVYSDCYFYNVV